MGEEYDIIQKGRRKGQLASPNRPGVRKEFKNEYTIDELLKVIYDHYDMSDQVSEVAIRNAYNEIAGTLIVQLTRKVEFKEGTLTLTVASAALKQELAYHKEGIKTKINAKIGEEKVKKIVIH